MSPGCGKKTATSQFAAPETIEGADSDTYTPTDGDAGTYLRATAMSYTDPQGSGQPEVSVVSANMVEMDDTNKAPEFPDQDMEAEGDQTDQERMVPENTEAAMGIGSVVMATDPNEDTLTYTLGGTDAASFSIVRDSGLLQTKAALNKEEKDTYMVTVTAMDPSGQSATINVTIKVTNVNEGPEVTGMDSVRVPENTAVSTAVETYMATDDEDDKAGTAITWSLSGTDDGAFDIDEGMLTFKQSPNYEDPAGAGTENVYNIMVVATDSDDQTDMMAVTVMVTNVDEAGTLTLSTLQPVDGIDVTATLTDIDGAVTGTAWKWAKSRNQRGAYTDIDGETAATYTPKPDDVNHYLRATATYTDGQGSDKTEMVISARKVLAPRSTNTPPVFNDADGDEIPADTEITREVAENTRKGEPVGSPVVAEDSEGDVLTYTLGGNGAGSFDIDVATGQLRTKAALDKEDAGAYLVTVTATDPYTRTGTTNSDMITVNITVTNVDEAPELTGMASVRVPENTDDTTDDTTAVATYTATDDEDMNTDVELELSGADAADFNLTDGVLTFKQSPNYEAPADAGTDNVYNVTVVATDSDNQTDMMAVTVMVTNVDEAGTVMLSTLQPRVGTPLTATLTDMDGAVSDVAWMWERGTGSSLGSLETIVGADSDTYTPTADDAGGADGYLRATATSYTDPQGSGQPAVSAVSANAVEMDDTNKAPEFPDQDMEAEGDQTDQERMVAENTVNTGDEGIGSAVTATDPNEDTLTYTLGGTDAASFSIVGRSGLLQTKAALDKEEKDTYMVTVTATDPSGLNATINVTIKVTNVDEPPVIKVGGLAISGRNSISYAENATGPVATYMASGPDADMAMWSLEGDDAGDFMFSGGMLTFRNSPDYENPTDMDMDNAYMVTIMADDGTYMDTHDVMVMVTNVEELGMVSGDATVSYAEDRMEAVATYTADGPDAASARWSVSGADMDDFDINGGMLTFAPMPNYEAPTDMGMDNVYQVTVEATVGGEMGMVPVTVTVTNVEEPGMVTLWAGTYALTMAPQVGETITGAVMDPDGGVMVESWQWASSATMDGAFDTIAEATSSSYTPVEADGGMYLRVTVTYTDGEGDGKMAMVTSATSATSANTAPMFATETAERMLPENTAAGGNVGAPVTAMDADNDTLTYSLGGTDMASFDVDPDTGQIMVGDGTMLDYEGSQLTYMVTVTATDPSGVTGMVDVMVMVTNVDEPGVVSLSAGADALTMAPQVGETITGAVMDPDGGLTDVTWQWYRSMTPDMMDSWMKITDATAAAYMLMDDDYGYYLRATAMYTDGEGMGKMASKETMMVPMNAAPMFESETDTREVAENTAAGMNIGDPVMATDNIGDTLAYTIGGADVASFAMDSDTGQLMTLAALDYETKATYSVTVVASDSGGLSDFIDVTITVTNVDEAPVITGEAAPNYAENGTGPVAAYTATDPESATITFTWTLEGDDAALFDLSSGGILTFMSSPDYENPMDANTDNAYMVTVKADDGTYMDTHNVMVTVTNEDEMGEVTLWAGTDALTMAPQVGDIITGAVMDPDGNPGDMLPIAMDTTINDVTWQWYRTTTPAMMESWMPITGATNDAYMVMAGDEGHYLRVMATYTDAAGTDMHREDSPATMMVTAMMTVPMFDSETATREVAENTAASMDIGDPVMGTDADGDTLIYTLGGTDAVSFDIDSATGQLKTLAALDYETKVTYSVMVTATDPDSASDMITVTITVTNVDEMGEVTLWAGEDPLTMPPQVGDTITGAVEDDDGGVTGEMWQWSRTMDTADMSSWMDIDGATEAAYMVMEGDTGYHLRVMATYTDAVGTDMDMAMVYSMPTMMVTAVDETQPADFDPLAKYDADKSGGIEKDEVIQAINDYLFGVGADAISKDDVIETINLYLFG